MYKTTFILLVSILAFTSCSEDSPADRWVGDEYRGSFSCLISGDQEVYDQATVSADGDEIRVTFKSASGPLIGTIDEFDQVEMQDYSLLLENGSTLELINGSGNFAINTNNADMVESEVLSITYQMEGQEDEICLFAFAQL